MPHAGHCCKKHGCKYGDDDCPVYYGTVRQLYPCEQCCEEREEHAPLVAKLKARLEACKAQLEAQDRTTILGRLSPEDLRLEAAELRGQIQAWTEALKIVQE